MKPQENRFRDVCRQKHASTRKQTHTSSHSGTQTPLRERAHTIVVHLGLGHLGRLPMFCIYPGGASAANSHRLLSISLSLLELSRAGHFSLVTACGDGVRPGAEAIL